MTLAGAVQRAGRAVPRTSPTVALVTVGTAGAWLSLAVSAAVGATSDSVQHQHHQGVAGVDPWNAGWVTQWLLMLAAMMWPLAAPTLALVERTAYRGWRGLLVATSLTTFTLLWLMAGLAVASVAALVATGGNLPWQLGCLTAAVVLSRSAARTRLLWRCAATPTLAPGGLRGFLSAAAAGAVAWRRCALLCGPAMAAMVVGHGLVLLLGIAMAGWWEAAHPRAWRDPVPVLLLAGTGVWLVLVELISGA